MPMASIQPKAPLLFEQIQQIEEMEIITQKLKEQDNAKKKSFISAGMESEEEGIPQFDVTDLSSPKKVRQGVVINNVDIQLEDAAERVRTGTVMPIRTPKGAAGFQMQLPGHARPRTGTTQRRGDQQEAQEIDGETEMERGFDGQASGFEDDAETEMERNDDAGSLMSGSDATSFQRVDQSSMRSGVSGATSFRRVNDATSTVTREISDFESDGTYMQREDDHQQ